MMKLLSLTIPFAFYSASHVACTSILVSRENIVGDLYRGGAAAFSGAGATTKPFTTITKQETKRGKRKNPFRQFLRLVTGDKKSTQQLYLESLEEQIQILTQQILYFQEESRQLRNKLSKSQSLNRREKSSFSVSETRISEQIQQERKAHVELEKELRDEISRLRKQIEDLTQMQIKLQALLEIERARLLEQEELIESQRQKILEAERKSKEQMEKMKESLLQESKTQMEKLNQNASDKYKALEFKSKKELEDLLEQEKKRGMLLVEAEKQKMRKLVKALAEREKKAAELSSSSKSAKKMKSPAVAAMNTKKFTQNTNSAVFGKPQTVVSTSGRSLSGKNGSIFGKKKGATTDIATGSARKV